MKLEQLLLTKKELPIHTIEGTLSCPNFQVPIHPKLMDPNIKIDEQLANNVFPQAAKDWHEDLSKVAQNDEWIKDAFLKEKPNVEYARGEQTITSIGWHDHVLTAKNGFASSLSISRNHGGTLYLDPNNLQGWIYRHHANFSLEKFKAYNSSGHHKAVAASAYSYIYSTHNIDHYPGALFLRNWAILYLNEALKQVF